MLAGIETLSTRVDPRAKIVLKEVSDPPPRTKVTSYVLFAASLMLHKEFEFITIIELVSETILEIS